MAADFVLHPLIHTSTGFAHAQDVEKKKAEPKYRPKARSLFFEVSSPRQNINARIVLDFKKKGVAKKERVSGNQCHKEGTEQA